MLNQYRRYGQAELTGGNNAERLDQNPTRRNIIGAILSDILEGNVPGYLGSLTPERARTEKEKVDRRMEAEKKSQAEIWASWQRELAIFAGIRVLATNMISSNEVVMQIQAYAFNGGVSKPFPVKLVQIGEQWKLSTNPINIQMRD